MTDELYQFYDFLKRMNRYYDNQLVAPEKIEDFEENYVIEFEKNLNQFRCAVKSLSKIEDFGESNSSIVVDSRVDLNISLVRLSDTFLDALELFQDSMGGIGDLKNNDLNNEQP